VPLFRSHGRALARHTGHGEGSLFAMLVGLAAMWVILRVCWDLAWRVGSPYSAVRSASGCPAGPSPLSGRPAPRPLDALREQILLPRDFEHPVPRRPADRGFGFVTKPFGLLAVSGRAALRAT